MDWFILVLVLFSSIIVWFDSFVSLKSVVLLELLFKVELFGILLLTIFSEEFDSFITEPLSKFSLLLSFLFISKEELSESELSWEEFSSEDGSKPELLLFF